MTAKLHDIEAVFAAFGMPCFPYRTFPPAAEAQRGATPPDRRRDRPRLDVRRPERPGPRRRVADEAPRILAHPAP